MNECRILRARDEGLLASYERRHGPRLVPAFDRDEVTAFGLAWNARIPVSKVGFDFAISNHGIEQLVALGVMSASGVRFNAEGPHFNEKDISGFLAELHGKSCDGPRPWSALCDVMREIDDRPKPWGPAFVEMLAGRVTYRLPRNFKSDLSSVEIQSADIPIITTLTFERRDDAFVKFAKFMVQRDVCEMFNVNQTKSKEIKFLPSSGLLPKRFECRVVEAKRSVLISRMELAVRFAVTWQRIQATLDERQVYPVTRKFYNRETALRNL